MKKIIAVTLILTLLFTTAAMASGIMIVATSGNTNVRCGPGLGYSIYGVLERGSGLRFDGGIVFDNRGVPWYSVLWNGYTMWVSSAYTEMHEM